MRRWRARSRVRIVGQAKNILATIKEIVNMAPNNHAVHWMGERMYGSIAARAAMDVPGKISAIEAPCIRKKGSLLI